MTDLARLVYVVGAVVALIVAVLTPSLVAAMNVCGWVALVLMTLGYDARTEQVVYLTDKLREAAGDE